ncbi:MAG: vitamin K epoxide reductase family protein [Thaumarchaeota archaeon]|nr:vitamin K epoxide reductase family protein [Nitrososphaerota archaeon]
MRDWHVLLGALSVAGLIDSVYLLSDVFFPTVGLICPTIGIVNCGEVTSTPFSRVFGVPVALLATLWFAVFLIFAIRRTGFPEYLLLPLWIVGVVFAIYLIGVEVLVIHAICPFCTVAHALGVAMGVPVVKLAMPAT